MLRLFALDDFLMLNPTFLPLDDILEDILEVVKQPATNSISVNTCKGKIVAREIPDDEFPGIALLYENGDGEPGAVMEYTPTHDTIQMRIYSAEHPDDEPVEILDMIPKENWNQEWVLTDNGSLQYQKKLGPRQYRMVEMVWLDTALGDEGYPDRPYTVKFAIFDLNDYSEKDMEIAVSGYYSGLEEVRKEYGKYADDVIAECIFEEITSAEASTTGMMTEEDAKETIKRYIATC